MTDSSVSAAMDACVAAIASSDDSVLAIGCDTVFIPDFSAQLQLPGSTFLAAFHPMEQRQVLMRADGREAEHFAVRWAAKEAFIKAWSNALYGHEPPVVQNYELWSQIAVICDGYRRTRLEFSAGLWGQILASIGHCTAHVSLSHDGDSGCAVVLLSRGRLPAA